ncbi:MAG TPA: hypothetical protein VL418_11250 [Devosiaceae bacterium]|nr:hypothetical protein [Devosiaceae bacterium]
MPELRSERPGPVLFAPAGGWGPLMGLEVNLGHIAWNWRDLHGLPHFLDDGEVGEGIVAASSEGGLFEYGSDAEIIGRLEVLRDGTGVDAAVAASVTRGDAATPLFARRGLFPIVPCGVEAFSALAAQAGWQLAETRPAAFSDQVLLVKG